MVIACVSLSGIAVAGASVGEEAPDFHGKDLEGKDCTLSQFRGKIVVLEWTNPKCPFVRKQYSQDNLDGVGALSSMQKMYTDPAMGAVWIMVASADPASSSYLDAAGWKAQLEKWCASPTALIIDDTAEIARLYDAWCTPEVFIINKEGILLYRGAVDSIRGADPNEVTAPANLHWLRNGLENAIKGRPVIPPETIPYGCRIR
jgi:alkyl hydroperoxide reductase subunit AhpC